MEKDISELIRSIFRIFILSYSRKYIEYFEVQR